MNLAGCNLMYVQLFSYLEQIIDHSLSDDVDINKDLKCFFGWKNALLIATQCGM